MTSADPEKQRQAVVVALEILYDLGAFAVVVSILENSHLHPSSYNAAARIILICKNQQQERLRDYDKETVKNHGCLLWGASI